MTIPKDLLDALMKDYKNPEDLIGESGLIKQLTKQLLERAMQAELTDHLGHEKNAPATNKSGNTRNGSYQKKVKGEFGELDITVPRDRDASFEKVSVRSSHGCICTLICNFAYWVQLFLKRVLLVFIYPLLAGR